MRALFSEVLVQLAVFVAVGVSSGIVYITDLPIYSALAPCAAEGASYIVQGLTGADCPASVTALESCACTKDQNSAAVLASITSNVQENCGKTASEDVASASLVFSAYCNQANAVTLPTGVPVTQYITDLPAYSDLGGCASDAVSYVVQGLTNEKCPAAASFLASCACTKDQNSLAVSESINSMVNENCGSTHSEDLTSAQAVFAGYCEMGNGTTSFPTASYLKGDVTYYITDLPTYSSLANCAQEAVSYPVGGLVRNDCPTDPRGAVSCLCVKDSNSQALNSAIISQVSENCGTTATEDVTSALGVFAFYCSAGKGLVTPSGVTASATTIPYGTGAGSRTSAKTGPGVSSGPTATNTNTGSTIQLPGLGSSSKKAPIGAIVGGVISGLIVIGFILAAGWILSRPKKPPAPTEPRTETQDPNALPSEKEAVGSPVNKFDQPIMRKPIPSVSVSPVSPVAAEESGLEHAPGMEAEPVMSATMFPPRPGHQEVSGSAVPRLQRAEDLPEVVNSGHHPEMDAGGAMPPGEVMASPVQRPIELGEGRPPRPPGPNMYEGRGW